MFIVSLSPEYEDLHIGDNLRFCTNEGNVKATVEVLAQKFPNKIIQVFKLERRVITECAVTMTTYRYNNKGELLPE